MVQQQFINGTDLAKCVHLALFVVLETKGARNNDYVRLNIVRQVLQHTPFDKVPEKIINEALACFIDIVYEPSSRQFVETILVLNKQYDAKDPWVPRCRRLLELMDHYYTTALAGNLAPTVLDHQEKGLLFKKNQAHTPWGVCVQYSIVVLEKLDWFFWNCFGKLEMDQVYSCVLYSISGKTIYSFRILHWLPRKWCRVQMMCIARDGEQPIDYDPQVHTGSHYMAEPYTARLVDQNVLQVYKGDGSIYYARPRQDVIATL